MNRGLIFSQSLKILKRQADAVKNAFQSLALEDGITMHWDDRLATVGFATKNVMATGCAVNSETQP